MKRRVTAASFHPFFLTSLYISLYIILTHIGSTALITVLGWTSLHYASAHSLYDIARYLMINGANPEVKNVDEETSIDVCDEFEMLEILTNNMLVTRN